MTTTSAPPRPPALDAGRAAAARERMAAALKSGLAALSAGETDIWGYAGCRLLAWVLAEVPGAYAARDAARLEKLAGELAGIVSRLPKHLADCRTPYAWRNRGPVEIDDPEFKGPARR